MKNVIISLFLLLSSASPAMEVGSIDLLDLKQIFAFLKQEIDTFDGHTTQSSCDMAYAFLLKKEQEWAQTNKEILSIIAKAYLMLNYSYPATKDLEYLNNIKQSLTTYANNHNILANDTRVLAARLAVYSGDLAEAYDLFYESSDEGLIDWAYLILVHDFWPKGIKTDKAALQFVTDLFDIDKIKYLKRKQLKRKQNLLAGPKNYKKQRINIEPFSVVNEFNDIEFKQRDNEDIDIAILLAINHNYDRAEILQLLIYGKNYLLLHNFFLAKLCFDNAIILAKKNNEPYLLAMLEIYLAKIVEIGKDKRAKLLLNANSIVENSNYNNIKLRALIGLIHIKYVSPKSKRNHNDWFDLALQTANNLNKCLLFEIYINLGNTDLVNLRKYYLEALKIADTNIDTGKIVQTLFTLVNYSNNDDDVLKYFAQIYSLVLNEKDELWLFKVSLEMAIKLNIMSSHKIKAFKSASLKYASLALKIAKKNRDKITNHKMAEILYYKASSSEPVTAIKKGYYKKALDLLNYDCRLRKKITYAKRSAENFFKRFHHQNQ